MNRFSNTICWIRTATVRSPLGFALETANPHSAGARQPLGTVVRLRSRCEDITQDEDSTVKQGPSRPAGMLGRSGGRSHPVPEAIQDCRAGTARSAAE